MTTFAETTINYPDGQQNVSEPPTDVLNNGFIPEISGARGQPLPAQWFNWLLRKLFRLINRDKVSDSNGVGLFTVANSVIRLEAFDRENPSRYIVAIGYKGLLEELHSLTVISSNTLTLGTGTISGNQPVLGGGNVVISATSRQFGEI